MKNVLLIALILFCSCFLKAQDYKKIDSLKIILNTTPPLNGTDVDTARMKLSLGIGLAYQKTKPDSAVWWFTSVADTVFNAEEIKKYPGKARQNSNAFYDLGVVAYYKGNYSLTISFFMRVLKINQELGYKKGIASCIGNLGMVYRNQGDYIKASEYYEKSLKINEEFGYKDGISNNLNNIGILYSEQGDYTKANEYYEKSLKINTELGDKTGISNCLINMGNVYKNQCDYPKATDYFEKSLKIKEELSDKRGIFSCIYALSDVYERQGNYDNALEYLQKSLKNFEELGNRLEISNCLNNIGIVYNYKYEITNAIEYFEKSLIIAKELGYKKGISISFNNLGLIYKNQGDYTKAMENFEKSMKIDEELGDKMVISNCLNNIGIVYVSQLDFSKASEYYEKSLKIKEELGDVAGLASDYPNLAWAYVNINKPKEALSLYLRSLGFTIAILRNNFSILSEKEKELYLNKTMIIFNDIHCFNLSYPELSDSLSGICYNNEMILKGLLLKSTRNMLNAARNSNDTVLSNSYYRLKQVRNQIIALEGLTLEESESKLEILEKKANEEERKLVKLSSEFSDIQNLFNYKWENVQKNLKKGEVAIEFVRLTQGEKNDTVVYVALMISAESKKPKVIKLFNESQLKKIINDCKGDDYQKVSKLYGTNQNVNNELYKLIWQPLEKDLLGITTVYYAPVGVLNNISFAALGNNNKLLCDKYNLQQVSSTRKLINPEPLNLNNNLTAAVFGGIDYNPDSVKQELWKYLPGTLTEKDIIQKQLQKKKVVVTSYSGKEASETVFKSLFTDKGLKPNIVHIATHGFFYPDPEQVKKETVRKTEQGLVAFRGSGGCGVWQFVQNKNPMMRSGLVFAGANRVWSGEWGKTDDEGVLTAQEVSQLNMKNTSLVVLSACETGLGDIKGSEGVYGLQRAFKMAGVRYIVMSLWQVPDKETMGFMAMFYTKLLKTKDIRIAFNETQKEMMQKYDPYFWGAFVLIE